MAPGKDAVGFNKIIQADREKKKHQDLADKIFGRRKSAPAAGALGARKQGAGAVSLAGRGGIVKSSKSARPAKVVTGLAARVQGGTLQRSTSTPQLNTFHARRTNAIDTALNGRSVSSSHIRNQVNVRSTPHQSNSGAGFSIRGSAAPRDYVVQAQNFAPGTTAEDVASVFCPDPDEMGLTSCRLLVEKPTVIIELVFNNQNGAEEVVKSYNNQKADNRLLYVYHTNAPPSSRADVAAGGSGRLPAQAEDDDAMEVEQSRPRHQRLNQTPAGPSKARPEVQDGRYGFAENSYRPNNEGDLFSDRIIAANGRSNMRSSGNFSRRR